MPQRVPDTVNNVIQRSAGEKTMRGSFKEWLKSKNSRPGLPSSERHPSWWHRTASDTVLVFVHGLLSDGTQCWTSSAGIYWPDLIKGDPELASLSLFIAQYYTGVDSGAYDVVQCASALFDSLRERKQGGPRVLDWPRIVFVCHSVGGIVTRRMLEENSNAFSAKKVGLVLLASPSLGSDYAYWSRPLSAIYGNRTVAALIPNDAMLMDLDRRFRILLEEQKIPGLIGAEACEHHSPGHWKWIPPIFSKIVSPASGSRYFGPTRIMERTDHSTIAKPGDREHPSYRFLKNFLVEKFPAQASSPNQSSSTAASSQLQQVPKSALVLFDVYSADCRAYYIGRQVDKDLERTLRMGSAWLTGISGAGKTAVVKRHADLHNVRHLEISLGHYRSDITSADLWVEIGAGVSPGKPLTSLNDVARELTRQDVCVVLDEVPIEAGRHLEIIGAINSLSEAIRRYSNGRSNILVCSIESPDLSNLGTKVLEHLHVMEVPSWTTSQLLSLCQLVELELPELAMEGDLRSEVVAAAAGAPRFVKSFFRRRLREAKDEPPSTSLALTVESFIHHGR